MRKIKFFSMFLLLALLLSVGLSVVMAQETMFGASNVPGLTVSTLDQNQEGVWAGSAGSGRIGVVDSAPLSQGNLSASESCRASSVPAALSSHPIDDWQSYEDPDYGFELKYPAEWEVETAIQQPVPFIDDEAIIKRLTFIGPEGLIDLDVWLSNGHDLGGWLDWYVKTRRELPITSPNATIAGQPAVAFVENGVTVDMLTAFFSDGRYVYRLWFTVTHNERGLQAYWRMLDTFTLPGGERNRTQVPEGVKQSAQQAAETSAISSIRGSSCCGYYSSGNPFPCCDNRGNCTWWVFYKYGWVPFRGDAGSWWDQVPDYLYWKRRTVSPKSNQENIAWWSYAASPSSGHVAYVANYTGGSTVSITEMSWCTSCYNARSISISTPSGYIYEKYPPQP